MCQDNEQNGIKGTPNYNQNQNISSQVSVIYCTFQTKTHLIANTKIVIRFLFYFLLVGKKYNNPLKSVLCSLTPAFFVPDSPTIR